MKAIQWRPALTSILLAVLAGQIAHLLAGNIAGAYAMLAGPPLSPPIWLMAAVWFILYILMGYAAYRIWISENPEKKPAIRLYGAQLLLNCIWPLVFFRWGAMWVAVILAAVLAVLVSLTLRRFSVIDRRAGQLLFPYLAWVLYGVYLSVGFAILN